MNTTIDLFDNDTVPPPLRLADGALLLRGFADPVAAGLLADIGRVAAAAPLRRMTTPGGRAMSVEMSNCGAVGWVSDASGYRYDPLDPLSRRRWPAMPDRFAQLATMAAAAAGFAGFEADACLINRYAVGARLSLHQDRDELDYSQPIVSVSLGLPANFVFGGPKRGDPTLRVALLHGDVVVWGGAARLHHHGVLTLKAGEHPLTGSYRYNLTLRRAR